MHPSSLVSYYPNYSILDEIVSYGDYKKINLFLDLKNNLQTIYMEHAVLGIVEASKRSRYLDTSVFSSIISFLSFHKIYGLKRGIDFSFYIFFETGESYYHKNLSKAYKISRKVDNLYGLARSDRDLFIETIQSNYQLIEKACNRIPNIYVIRLHHLEADFIPYYLITRNLVDQDQKTVNLIYSNDHDLWQCVNEKTYIFSKTQYKKEIIRCGTIMERFLKRRNNIPDSYLPLAMAVIGDSGDDVEGIKGIGPSRFLELFPSLREIIGDMNEIYDKVESGLPLFPDNCSFPNKYLELIKEEEERNSVVSRNLKMVSFELLSRELESPTKTEMLDRKKHIHQCISSKQTSSVEQLRDALLKVGVTLEDSSIEVLYI